MWHIWGIASGSDLGVEWREKASEERKRIFKFSGRKNERASQGFTLTGIQDDPSKLLETVSLSSSYMGKPSFY